MIKSNPLSAMQEKGECIFESCMNLPDDTACDAAHRDAFLADFSIINSMPGIVPAPESLNLSNSTSDWSNEDWVAYAEQTWSELQTVECPRTFNLCEQVCMSPTPT